MTSASPLNAVLGREERLVSGGDQDFFKVSLINAKKALERLRNEEEELLQTIKRLKEALAIHKVLPYDILCKIFTAVAEEYDGPLTVPLCYSGSTPPQLVLSNVCSEWRGIALSIAELWNHVCHEWLRKARSLPVTLEFDLHRQFRGQKIRERNAVDLAVDLVQKVMSLQDLRVSKLCLSLSEQQFLALDQLTPEVVSHLNALELEFLPSFELRENTKSLPHFAREYPGPPCVSFPWGRLRRLRCRFANVALGEAIQVLQHMPLLEELKTVFWMRFDTTDVPAKAVSLFHLRAINIQFYRLSSDYKFRFFECPNLKKLDIVDTNDDRITDASFDIISRQYNLRRLERFVFGSAYKTIHSSVPFLKLSTILKEAPMLRHCSVKHSILDEDAVVGIATGELGQFLEHLDVRILSDLEVVLNMLEGRLQAVKNSNQVSLLKMVGLWQD
ncbi:hypothetical protein JOM56_009053 [Amanita muscaria]